MDNYIWSLLIGVLTSLISIVLISITLRICPDWTPVTVFMGGITLAAGLAVLIGSTILDQFHFWQALAAVCAVGIANFFLFSAVYKSVSLQMLGVLNTQTDRFADKGMLVEVVARPSVEKRMELLVEMGMVAKSPDQTYTPTEAGRRTIYRLQKLQRLFGINSSGLYSNT